MSNPSFSTRQAHLALAGQSSGTGWLSNLLLELSIPVTPAGCEQTWQNANDGWQLTPPAFRRLRGVLPAVHHHAQFVFPDTLEVVVEDNLAHAVAADSPAIVLQRDPRAALPGQWARAVNASSWDDFQTRALGPFHLPPPEAWAVQTLLWDALAKVRPVHIVRYENLQADTAREVARVLGFLGIARDDAEIAQAVTLSGFERAQETLSHAARAAGALATYPGRGIAPGGASVPPLPLSRLTGAALCQAGYPVSAPRWEPQGGFAALRAQAPPAAQTVLERAQADMAVGNLKGALARLASAVSGVPGGDPGDAPLLATLTALRWATQLFAEAPDDSASVPCAFHLFCDINQAFGDDPWVRIAQMHALTVYAPKHGGAYNIWGKTLHGLGRAADAEQVFDAACTAGAESALLRSNLAVIAWQDGRRDLALAQILRAARLDPHEPGVAANLEAMQSALQAA